MPQTVFAAQQFQQLLEKIFTGKKVFITGAFARQMEIITALEFVVEENMSEAEQKLSAQEDFTLKEKTADVLTYHSSAGISIIIHPVTEKLIEKLVETSSSPAFFKALAEKHPATETATDEKHYFGLRNITHIPAFAREDADTLLTGSIPETHLQHTDVKGLIHCHSDWSDGDNTIEQLANAAKERGMEYMAISDHSKTAVYAQGLTEEKLKAQHLYIDELNEKLKPFRIFKKY